MDTVWTVYVYSTNNIKPLQKNIQKSKSKNGQNSLISANVVYSSQNNHNKSFRSPVFARVYNILYVCIVRMKLSFFLVKVDAYTFYKNESGN